MKKIKEKIKNLNSLKNIILFGVTLCVSLSCFSEVVSIKVGNSRKAQSSLALPMFKNQGGGAAVRKKLYKAIEKNFYVSGFFRLINPKAFLENTNYVGLKPIQEEAGGFDFKKWKILKAHILVRAGVSVSGGKMRFEVYAYYVSSQKLAFSRNYEVGEAYYKKIANQFCDDLIEALTGKKSVFSTKIVSTVKVGRQNKAIYTLDWNGENLAKATERAFGSLSLSPAWSPDGKKIAFTAYAYHKRAKTRNPDLFLLDRKTKKSTLISYVKGMNSGAYFHPDGRSIYYTISRRGGAHIYRIDLSTRRATPVITSPKSSLHVEPALSQDGKKLAFSSSRSGRPMIYMTDSSGRSKPQRLTFAGRYNSNPSFSPDGKTLVFASYTKGHYDIFSLNMKTKQIKRLTSFRKTNGRSANHTSPSFSPDGRLIVFASDRLTSNNQLYIMSSDGSYVRRISFDRFNYESPRWSPFLKD